MVIMALPFDLDLIPLAPGWDARVKLKLIATALVTCSAHAVASLRKGLPLGNSLPRQLWGYGSGMVTFCAVQEGLRAARGDVHDAWNSAAAGAVAGASLAARVQGRKYARLGGVMWCSVAAAAHLLNSLLQPRIIIEDLLIDGGLLSPAVAERRHGATGAGHTSSALSSPPGAANASVDELMRDAARIRQRELAELAAGGGRRTEGGSSGRWWVRPGRQAQQPNLAAETVTGVEVGDDAEDEEEFRSWLAAQARVDGGGGPVAVGPGSSARGARG